MSGFSSLNVASSALAAQQRAMEVTGQNIANASTPGYTRQRTEFEAVPGGSAYTFFSRSDGLGSGVSADTVTRIRDAFLERRGQLEHGTSAQAAAVDTSYAELETSFGEPGDKGVQALMTKAWAAWGQLSTSPTDATSRTAVLSTSAALAQGLNRTSGAIDAQWRSTHVSTTDQLSEVNADLKSVADLNRAIAAAVSTGLNANELQDQRDTLVGRLADTIGAVAVETENGMVNVLVGGNTVVGGLSANQLRLGGPTNPSGMGAPVTISIWPSGSVVDAGGTLGGQLTAMNTVIPGYRGELDAVAADITARVNGLQAGGFDQDGQPGGPVFGGTTAGSITVVMTDKRALAAAGTGPSGTNASSDGSNADAIAQLARLAGGPDTAYRTTVTKLGVEARSATSAAASAAAVVTQVDASRQSVSGVSLDEEMTNMLVFKQSYAAAARMVTAVDEMLDVLINRTGLVGR